jgi:hypothetical protein
MKQWNGLLLGATLVLLLAASANEPPPGAIAVHAYTPAAIQRAIAAGVKCIEHGQLMDEPTARLMADRGIWLSIQPFPDEIADVFPPGSQEAAKAREVTAGTARAYARPKNTKSRRRSVRTSFFPASLRSGKAACWLRWPAGTARQTFS